MSPGVISKALSPKQGLAAYGACPGFRPKGLLDRCLKLPAGLPVTVPSMIRHAVTKCGPNAQHGISLNENHLAGLPPPR